MEAAYCLFWKGGDIDNYGNPSVLPDAFGNRADFTVQVTMGVWVVVHANRNQFRIGAKRKDEILPVFIREAALNLLPKRACRLSLERSAFNMH